MIASETKNEGGEKSMWFRIDHNSHNSPYQSNAEHFPNTIFHFGYEFMNKFWVDSMLHSLLLLDEAEFYVVQFTSFYLWARRN